MTLKKPPLELSTMDPDSKKPMVKWGGGWIFAQNSEAPEVILGKEYNCSCDVGEA